MISPFVQKKQKNNLIFVPLRVGQFARRNTYFMIEPSRKEQIFVNFLKLVTICKLIVVSSLKVQIMIFY